MKRSLCPHCRKRLSDGERIHRECVEPWAEAQADKADRKRAKAIKTAAKEERAQDKAKREKMKSRQDWLREAQSAFNRYIRARDHFDGCISCSKGPDWGGQWHASHFRSVGAASSVRFNEWNVHKACSVCNNHLSGNIGSYRPRLIEKIGHAKVDFLESSNLLAKYDVSYLKRLKTVYSRKAARMERRNGVLRY